MAHRAQAALVGTRRRGAAFTAAMRVAGASHVPAGLLPKLLALLLLACDAWGAPGGSRSGVLEHHGGPRRDGVYVDATLTRAAAASFHVDAGFRAAVPGAIYAQPLYVPGPRGQDLVVVATEANQVAAFDARSGASVWTRRLAEPVPVSRLPCGNIDPLGITGTPVADPAARTLYLDAMTTPDGGATRRHLVFALSLDDGSTRPGWPIGVAELARRRGLAFEDAVQNQRGALALAGGMLYVPFGGHYGDCGRYRGTILAVPASSPSQATVWATGARGGGIWAPSGIALADGQLFAATGNTFGASAWSGGEAVVRFPAGVPLPPSPSDYFTPRNWRELDEGDVDIGGTGPVVVDVPGASPSRLVVALGKDGKIYLLDRARLGGVGGQLAAAQVASGSIINAAAAYTTARGTYVVFRGEGKGCPAGQSGDLTAVRIVPGAPPSVEVAWCARLRGRGSPMVTTTDGRSEAIVWIVGAEGDDRLHGFDGETGKEVYRQERGSLGGVRRFQTPILAGGRIFVAVEGGVKAFVR
jgi:outer membrane protein assembly factor BamB